MRTNSHVRWDILGAFHKQENVTHLKIVLMAVMRLPHSVVSIIIKTNVICCHMWSLWSHLPSTTCVYTCNLCSHLM